MASKGESFSLKAYAGDHKTLLAFNFADPRDAESLAGFSIQCTPPGRPSYYLFNTLRFADPSQHRQDAAEDPRSSKNAPFQKYRWVHVLGVNHQGLAPATGEYAYCVTPRYFDAQGSMQALDGKLSKTTKVNVGPFRKGALRLGFTRGYMQSEAFANHFGLDALLVPPGKPLLFDTSQKAGTNKAGQSFTFADEYAWTGSTAREQALLLLNAVLGDPSLSLRVFAYDLNEPDVCRILLALAEQGRVRIVLDNAELHVDHKDRKTGKNVRAPEDEFATLFRQKAKAPAALLRGRFGRYSHDKILIVDKGGAAIQVLTGSTNFSVTGLYVNANHVLVFDDANVAAQYGKVFEESWRELSAPAAGKGKKGPASVFAATPFATAPYTVQSASVPRMSVTFSPHTKTIAGKILKGISDRVKKESTAPRGSVLFAVMQLTGSDTPVYKTLSTIYGKDGFYSYGISDSPGGTHLYAPGSAKGVLVSGKPGKTTLPQPFSQVPTPPGHEIHDKFVVCGFNRQDPVVYCGSSNLASGGETQNGDNLLEIHDADVAAAFAIEALLLVDHYNFLDRYAKAKKQAKRKPLVKREPLSKTEAAAKARMNLHTGDAWSKAYYDENDLHWLERELLA